MRLLLISRPQGFIYDLLGVAGYITHQKVYLCQRYLQTQGMIPRKNKESRERPSTLIKDIVALKKVMDGAKV